MNSLFQAFDSVSQAFFGELLGGCLGMVIPSPDLQRPLGTIFRVGGFCRAKVPMAWKIQDCGAGFPGKCSPACQGYFLRSSITTAWVMASRSCSRPKRWVGDLIRCFSPLNFRLRDRRLDLPCVSISVTSRIESSEILALRCNQGMRVSMDIMTLILIIKIT